MRHLFNTVAEVLRLQSTFDVGEAKISWVKVEHIVDPFWNVPGEMLCRFDLNFVRIGKDQPPPVTAGRTPDRVGLLFFDAIGDTVRANDRIRPITGPITGMFEIRAVPDPAVAFASAHHFEVQVVEVSQAARTNPGWSG